jgi:FtsZ-binding cell division protein ZapB
MNILSVLEEKIKLLVGYIQKLQSEKSALMLDRETLEHSNRDLIAENARLAKENIQLQEKVDEARVSSTKGNKQLETLNKERDLTKVALDELIKSIDGLVKSEAQQ